MEKVHPFQQPSLKLLQIHLSQVCLIFYDLRHPLDINIFPSIFTKTNPFFLSITSTYDTINHTTLHVFFMSNFFFFNSALVA